MGVFSRRKKLAPSLRIYRPLDDLAFGRRHELKADFAALRTVRMILVLGVRLLDLVGFFDFFVRDSG